MMLWLFVFGLAVDAFLSQRLGQTSLLLLLIAGILQLFKNLLPRKIDKQIKLK